MRIRWRFAAFIVMVFCITALLHFYFYQRLGVDTNLPRQGRIVVGIITVALFSSLIGLNLFLQILPKKIIRFVAYPVYVWMGMMFFLFWSLALTDLAVWILGKFAYSNENLRVFLSFASLFFTCILTLYSIWNVWRGPIVKQVDVPLHKWADKSSSLKIIQLTDIHIGPTLGRSFIERIVDLVNREQADLIVLTGDLIDGKVEQLYEDIQPLQDLKAKLGIYFVPGNHEYFSDADSWSIVLKDFGFVDLTNKKMTLRHPSIGEFELAGVDDHHSNFYVGHGADFTALMDRNHALPLILLAHQPIVAQQAAQLGVDLVLSGHTHGGQIWPWHYFVYLQQPYLSGLFKIGKTNLYVSEGTGYWGPPMRLGSNSEITRIMVS